MGGKNDNEEILAKRAALSHASSEEDGNNNGSESVLSATSTIHDYDSEYN